MGAITEVEALAAVGRGALPVTLQGVIDAIEDSAQQFAAKMFLAGAEHNEKTIADFTPVVEQTGILLWRL